jgi:hypothetical protein
MAAGGLGPVKGERCRLSHKEKPREHLQIREYDYANKLLEGRGLIIGWD